MITSMRFFTYLEDMHSIFCLASYLLILKQKINLYKCRYFKRYIDYIDIFVI